MEKENNLIIKNNKVILCCDYFQLKELILINFLINKTNQVSYRKKKAKGKDIGKMNEWICVHGSKQKDIRKV